MFIPKTVVLLGPSPYTDEKNPSLNFVEKTLCVKTVLSFSEVFKNYILIGHGVLDLITHTRPEEFQAFVNLIEYPDMSFQNKKDCVEEAMGLLLKTKSFQPILDVMYNPENDYELFENSSHTHSFI